MEKFPSSQTKFVKVYFKEVCQKRMQVKSIPARLCQGHKKNKNEILQWEEQATESEEGVKRSSCHLGTAIFEQSQRDPLGC